MRVLSYRNRRAAQIENSLLRVTLIAEGGHVAEILHKENGINPLWTPPWPSIEPSSYDPIQHPEYGQHNESQLLSGILGHNLCLDIFGAPSAEEAAAGVPVHGEAPVAVYDVGGDSNWIELQATFPKSQLRFKRTVSLSEDSPVVRFSETLENLTPSDRPIGWTQHVTLGSPFLERGRTEFRISGVRSKVIGSSFNDGNGSQQADAEFDWPVCPLKKGGTTDLRVFTKEPVSAGFTAHLMNPEMEHAWFTAYSPRNKLLFGYAWKRSDFPWLARWEENHLRTQPPWNSNGLTCGMEFGVSPFAESRRQMVNRGSMFGVPTFRWLPARTCIKVDYCAFLMPTESIPDRVTWNGGDEIELADDVR